MVVTAVFCGQDNSLGYKLDKIYRLDFNVEFNHDKLRDYVRIQDVKDIEGSSICYYSSLKKFTDNWKIIK